ncbi:MAG: type IV pilus assembly protein PilM [Candidatus Edwardsbacteria bacterium]
MLFGKKKSTVGLDIGSHQIKVVEIQKDKKGARLLNYGIAPLAPEAIVEGEIMDRGLVIEAIKNLLETQHIKCRDVVSAISGRGVIVKRIMVERMKESEARERMKWEAEQHVPFAITDVSLDFQILNPEAGENQMEVLLVAVKNETINTLVDLITAAGLNPVVIDCGVFAMQNVFETNYESLPEEMIALVNIGADMTNINFVKNSIPAFTRDLPIAGNSCAQQIQKNLGLSFEQSLNLMKGEEVKETTQENAKSVIRSFTSDFAGGIERTLSFLSASGESEKMSRIFLSGGGALIPGVEEFLKEHFGIPVEILNPLRKIGFDPALFGVTGAERVAPILTTAIGLGLKEVR